MSIGLLSVIVLFLFLSISGYSQTRADSIRKIIPYDNAIGVGVSMHSGYGFNYSRRFSLDTRVKVVLVYYSQSDSKKDFHLMNTALQGELDFFKSGVEDNSFRGFSFLSTRYYEDYESSTLQTINTAYINNYTVGFGFEMLASRRIAVTVETGFGYMLERRYPIEINTDYPYSRIGPTIGCSVAFMF